MTDTDTTIAEIVTFRLLEGSDPATFVRAAAALDPVLQATGHVLSRTLSSDDDGVWTDHILWTSLDVAQETAGRLMADPVAAPMMQMIDPAHVQMRHARVCHRQE